MINLGNVVADSTIRIPFNSFDAAGASVTLTGFAIGDIKIYKDGGTTERSSTNGYTATTDFDSLTGAHVAVIDLSDNSDTDFYEVGSTYDVAIDSVTIDGETVRFWAGRFAIENASVGSRIKSIQHKDVNIPAGEIDDDVSITSVDTTKAVIQLRGIRVDSTASSAGLSSCLAVASFSGGGSTVRGLREGSIGNCTLAVEVIEYE